MTTSAPSTTGKAPARMCAPTPREAINVPVGLVPPWQMTGILAKAVMDVTSITEAAPTNALTATVRCSVSVLKVESIHIWQCFALVLCYLLFDKVEKILKGSLDSITFTFHENSNYVFARRKGKTLRGVVKKLLKTKSLLTSPSNVLPYYLTNELNFH